MLLRSAAAGGVAVVVTERSRTESGIMALELMAVERPTKATAADQACAGQGTPRNDVVGELGI